MVDFWKILNWLSTLGIIGLILSMLFVPLELFAQYSFPLLITIVVLIAITLLRGFIQFMREIPKRRWGTPKQEAPSRIFLGLKAKTWKTIAEWTGTLVVLVILVMFQRGALGSKDCPDLIRGDREGSTIVQYFYTPFCPACWKGERFMQETLGRYPEMRFENYDGRYCKDEAILSSPAYRIMKGNATQVVYGLDANRFNAAICAVGGECQ